MTAYWEEPLDEWQAPSNAPTAQSAHSTPKQHPQTEAELLTALQEREIRAYPRRQDLINPPTALKQERRPEMADMSLLSRHVAAQLDIPEALAADAVRMALNTLKATEAHTDGFTNLCFSHAAMPSLRILRSK